MERIKAAETAGVEVYSAASPLGKALDGAKVGETGITTLASQTQAGAGGEQSIPGRPEPRPTLGPARRGPEQQRDRADGVEAVGHGPGDEAGGE